MARRAGSLAIIVMCWVGCGSRDTPEPVRDASLPSDAGDIDAAVGSSSTPDAAEADRDTVDPPETGSGGRGGSAGRGGRKSAAAGGGRGGSHAAAAGGRGQGGSHELAAGSGAAGSTAAAASGGAGGTAGSSGGAAEACVTRITYGSAWIRPADHATDWDEVPGIITWDGRCDADPAGNAVAELSNGWKPRFAGALGCVISLDQSPSCPMPTACSTHISYGPAWIAPSDHPDRFDDVDGVVTTDAVCTQTDDDAASLTLSNGWQPQFTGRNACAVALRYSQCGALFTNPVVATDCPDPGVLRADEQYVMACTGPDYPLRTSDDLVHWTQRGSVFSDATRPTWATGDFWAPEIHRVGTRYVVYFSARHSAGDLSIGAASADDALGPYTDLGEPLLRGTEAGVIDAHELEAPDGSHYLVWKTDGNASGAASTIQIQPLRADGLALTGSPTELLRNTLAWEGDVVEGPWLIFEAGYYYLFYSGNSYASAAYALGVARSTSPTGPFTKASVPILASRGEWAGPGHGSVVRSPHGAWVHVFHAWPRGFIGQVPPGREVLVSRIAWDQGWPIMRSSLSSHSQPLP
jgi:GH43 family beta-xylosidase